MCVTTSCYELVCRPQSSLPKFTYLVFGIQSTGHLRSSLMLLKVGAAVVGGKAVCRKAIGNFWFINEAKTVTFTGCFLQNTHTFNKNLFGDISKLGFRKITVNCLLNRKVSHRFFSMMETPFAYDVAVIGGGSGGIACAKECAKNDLRTVVFDYVTPSTQGTRWGLGGTCVNVGCVPKKLMHYASQLGPLLAWDSKVFGLINTALTNKSQQQPDSSDQDGIIDVDPINCNWNTLVQTVQNYVKFLNFNCRNGLKESKVDYFNSYATIESSDTISYIHKTEKRIVKFKNLVIAVGGRPYIPKEVPGALEYAITSDDIFSLKKNPGRVLVVGGSYIALECAGFLTDLGFNVQVAVRSLLLRGFDRQCSEKVGGIMGEIGTKFHNGFVVKSIKIKEGVSKHKSKPLVVVLTPTGTQNSAQDIEIDVDTVLYSTGRKADIDNLGCDNVGIKISDNGRIVCGEDSQTTVKNIFAIGDTVEGFPELTPVAVKAGEILARKIARKSNEIMNFNNIPTTVFTPVEYGCVGLSEEQAIEKYGCTHIETYLQEFNPLEISAVHRPFLNSPICLSKLITLKSDDYKVIGVHFVGPNASELMQGMAIAVKMGAKKADFDNCVGIHPSNAESFVGLNITRSSGQNFIMNDGCGGGKCG